MWKQTLLEWHRGIPAAGVAGIGMYVPYERLSSPVEGPLLTREVAEQFAKSKHVTHTKAKAYNPKFTTAQKQAIVQALDELILMFQASDTALTTILHGYRSNLPWHDVPN